MKTFNEIVNAKKEELNEMELSIQTVLHQWNKAFWTIGPGNYLEEFLYWNGDKEAHIIQFSMAPGFRRCEKCGRIWHIDKKNTCPRCS